MRHDKREAQWTRRTNGNMEQCGVGAGGTSRMSQTGEREGLPGLNGYGNTPNAQQ